MLTPMCLPLLPADSPSPGTHTRSSSQVWSQPGNAIRCWHFITPSLTSHSLSFYLAQALGPKWSIHALRHVTAEPEVSISDSFSRRKEKKLTECCIYSWNSSRHRPLAPDWSTSKFLPQLICGTLTDFPHWLLTSDFIIGLPMYIACICRSAHCPCPSHSFESRPRCSPLSECGSPSRDRITSVQKADENLIPVDSPFFSG